MKIMIASDIHGSAYCCEKLLERFREEGAERLLLLGDLLYHGPRNDLPKEYDPKRVIALLNEVKESVFCVRGNCDTEVDQMVLEFPILADYCILYWEDHMIYATHGHHYNLKQPPALHKGDILLNGHTHVVAFEKVDNYYYMNPGSVSIPKEETKQGYIMIEDKSISYKDLDGNTYMIKTSEDFN